MKSITLDLLVPERGERAPRLDAHSDMSYALGLVREARPFRERHWAEATVTGCPDELDPRRLRAAVQMLLDLGGGLANPCRFTDLMRTFDRFEIEAFPGGIEV